MKAPEPSLFRVVSPKVNDSATDSQAAAFARSQVDESCSALASRANINVYRVAEKCAPASSIRPEMKPTS
jgi:hypothetical protein